MAGNVLETTRGWSVRFRCRDKSGEGNSKPTRRGEDTFIRPGMLGTEKRVGFTCHREK